MEAQMISPYELAYFSLQTKAASALAVVLLWWLILRGLDIIGGQKFTDLWHVLKSDPDALAKYLGMRALAVACIILAVAFL